jgi:hypothetical protein
MSVDRQELVAQPAVVKLSILQDLLILKATLNQISSKLIAEPNIRHSSTILDAYFSVEKTIMGSSALAV